MAGSANKEKNEGAQMHGRDKGGDLLERAAAPVVDTTALYRSVRQETIREWSKREPDMSFFFVAHDVSQDDLKTRGAELVRDESGAVVKVGRDLLAKMPSERFYSPIQKSAKFSVDIVKNMFHNDVEDGLPADVKLVNIRNPKLPVGRK